MTSLSQIVTTAKGSRFSLETRKTSDATRHNFTQYKAEVEGLSDSTYRHLFNLIPQEEAESTRPQIVFPCHKVSQNFCGVGGGRGGGWEQVNGERCLM